MVGFCGVAGNTQYEIDDLIDKLIYLGDESPHNYSGDQVKIGSVFFKESQEKQPVSTHDDSLIWLWGEIYGFNGPDKYSTKPSSGISNAQYCAELYKEHGIEFVSRLNGVFAGILYDQKKQQISLFTDRLGTHPIFFATTKEELVFSTQIQSIPFYPSMDTSFDMNYLSHFLTFERVLGTKTVLKGVKQVHPGSILSYDLSSGELKNKIYWSPKYEPKDRSYSKIVEEFIGLFRNIIRERINEDLTYGLYLSGGSDSRLVLAIIKDLFPDLDLICYHLNESMNREARIAKRVADKCDFEFKLLKRGKEYQEKVLDATSPISIFSSWFDQAHFIGFRDNISNEVDRVIHGNYSDTILDRHYLPKKSFKIPLLNEIVYLPTFRYIKSFDEFLELYLEGHGAFCREGKIPKFLKKIDIRSIRDSLKSELKAVDEIVLNHGVMYPSFEDFVHWWGFYPLTNTRSYLVYYSEIQSHNSFTPFLDSRIVDFSLSLSDCVVSQKNLVDDVIKKVSSSLAEIPHGGTNMPLKSPKIFHFLKGQYDTAKIKLFPNQRFEGPWGDPGEIIRQYDFVENRLLKKKDLIREYSFLDYNEIKHCHSEHMKGKDNKGQLFSILSFIENPITEYLLKA